VCLCVPLHVSVHDRQFSHHCLCFVVMTCVCQAKQAALPPPPPLTAEALAGGHDGEWRSSRAGISYVTCATTVSSLGLSDKRLCTHKKSDFLIGFAHWTCCGESEVKSLCTGPGAYLRIPVVPFAALPGDTVSSSSAPAVQAINLAKANVVWQQMHLYVWSVLACMGLGVTVEPLQQPSLVSFVCCV
jgi:hypothetical protein